VIDDEIGRLTREPVSAKDLTKAKNQLQTAFWAGLASSEGKAERLGEFEIATGDYRNLTARAGEYSRVTAEDVLRVAKQYLGTGARSVVVATPSSP
jgi:predicted Zn-dependent peptidase